MFADGIQRFVLAAGESHVIPSGSLRSTPPPSVYKEALRAVLEAAGVVPTDLGSLRAGGVEDPLVISALKELVDEAAAAGL